MKTPQNHLSRHEAVTHSGIATAALLGLSGNSAHAYADAGIRRDDVARVITETLFADTHEHLVEEHSRTEWSQPVPLLPCDDWALLFSHYLNSDLIVAGMPPKDYAHFTSPTETTDTKWRLLEPHWKHVRHTGYARAVRIAMEHLYDVTELNVRTVHQLAERHTALVRPGFYATVLREHAGVETCQVNSLQAPFMESRQPDLLLQDLSIVAFGGFSSSNWNTMTDAQGTKATDLAGWHRIIDHYFEKYGPYAVAVKSQTAYQRRLNFADVPPEIAAPIFAKLLAKEPVTPAERQSFDDHVFWYCVGKTTAQNPPVKLHTGYFAGHGSMPLERVSTNPGDAADLLRRAPETTFVLMHIGYPYQEATLSLAKHYPNAVIDLCWTWIINPEASARYLRDHLVTAPSNKILTFGGDYIPVEPIVGHAAIARRGIARTLQGLEADSWLTRSEAVELVEPLMRGTARRLFRVEEKLRRLASAPWRPVVQSVK